MQIHGEDRVELTVLLDEGDYRRIAAESSRSRRWRNLVLLPLPIGAFVSLAAEQLIGAVSVLASMFSLAVLGIIVRRRQLTSLPDWAFSPTTYRVSSEGIEIESAVARRSVRWLAISGWRKSDAAYWFAVPGGVPLALPRRTLSSADEAALERVLTRFDTVGSAIAYVPEVPPPSVAPVRAASPDASVRE